MKFPLNQFLLAVSDSLDFVEIDVLGATSNHARRVAYISLRLAESFGFSDEELYDLCSFSILHDNGLCQEVFLGGIELPQIKDKRNALESYRVHCRYGEENVERYPFLTNTRDVILYHHENWDGSGYFGVKGDDIPLMAQIVALADTVDNLFHFETPSVANRKKIVEFITVRSKSWFSPSLVEAFLDTQKHLSFWLDMQEPQLYDKLNQLLPCYPQELSLNEVYEITRVFSKIVDSKSPFTRRHSSGLEEKAENMGRFYGWSEEKVIMLKISASLHDLGKLAIPNIILDKPAQLDSDEMEIMKSHVYYTGVALEKISEFGEMKDWAAHHHERLDGSGYPNGICGDKLSFEERLLMCLDMYQALTEERPYRSIMAHDKAMEILTKEANSGKIDFNITKDIDKVFGEKR